LRMEEVLLNRAEAYLMLNQYDKAIADLNLYASQRFVIARSPASKQDIMILKNYVLHAIRYSISIKPNLIILITSSISTIRQTLGVI